MDVASDIFKTFTGSGLRSTPDKRTVIEKPGIYDGISAKDYHSDPCVAPSLSSTIARTISGKSMKHAWIEHPRFGGRGKESTPAMTKGSIVHALLAGSTDEFEVGVYDSFRSGDARAWKARVESDGKIAVLERDLDMARPIEAAIRDKVAAGNDNTPFADHVKSEVTAVWQSNGAWCRARYDKFDLNFHYLDIWDWKVTTDVDDHAIERKIAEYRYDIQVAHYMAGIEALYPKYNGRMSMTLVFAEDKEPYTVRCVKLSPEFAHFGQIEQRRAVRQWSHAVATNEWPELGGGQIFEAHAPAYIASKYEDEITAS